MSDTFQIGKVYIFSTNAASLLGAEIKNAKLTGILDYVTARNYDNIDLKYRTIYPVLDPNTPDSVENCIFYKFKTESGDDLILANQWIDMTSVTEVVSINLQITLTAVASLNDIVTIRNALTALGYLNFSIKQI